MEVESRSRSSVLDDGILATERFRPRCRDSSAARRARSRGPDVMGPRADEYAALARRVAGSGADAVYLGGLIDTNAGGVLRDLRRRLPDDVDLLGPGGLTPVPLLMQKSKGAARGMYLSFPGVLPESFASGRGSVGRHTSARRNAACPSNRRPSTPPRPPRFCATLREPRDHRPGPATRLGECRPECGGRTRGARGARVTEARRGRRVVDALPSGRRLSMAPA